MVAGITCGGACSGLFPERCTINSAASIILGGDFGDVLGAI